MVSSLKRNASRFSFGYLVLFFLITLGSKKTEAQEAIPALTWSAKVDKMDLKVGDVVTVTFTSEVPEGWYVYSTNIKCAIGPIKPSLHIIDSSAMQIVGDLTSVGDIKEKDEIFNCEIAKFTKTVRLKQQFRVLKIKDVLGVKLNVQMCNKVSGLCAMDMQNFKLTLSKLKKTDRINVQCYEVSPKIEKHTKYMRFKLNGFPRRHESNLILSKKEEE